MRVRVLADVERGEMKAESAHATDQTAHLEHAGVLALVGAQAVGDEIEVAEELVRRIVVIGARRRRWRAAAPSPGRETHDTACDRAAPGDSAASAGQQGPVLLDARLQRFRDADARRALRQRLGQALAFEEVAVDDDLLMTRARSRGSSWRARRDCRPCRRRPRSRSAGSPAARASRASAPYACSSAASISS